MAQDPYTAKAKEDIPLKDKTQELTKFMEECKYAMMTTINKASGLMSSRAMAIAAAVSHCAGARGFGVPSHACAI